MARWLKELQLHPLRNQLSHELHARPFESISAPLEAFMFVKYTGETAADKDSEHLIDFCINNQITPPNESERHFSAKLQDYQLRWERHGEFTTYTAFVAAENTAPFDKTPPESILSLLAKTEGELLVATHLSIREQSSVASFYSTTDEYFEPESTVGANIASDEAQVWTDLQIHESGFNRILMLNKSLKPQKMGRVSQRLLDISTYRNMALLAFPKAQSAAREINYLDQKLTSLLTLLNDSTQTSEPEKQSTNTIENDSEILESLTSLSMQIQHLSAKVLYRLSAADAYYALVNSRIKELNEARVSGYQTIGEFLQRRLSPAMRTCSSVQKRLEVLSVRTSRAVDLLRTRLDLTLEHQNHALLETMNKRAKVQLRLQETVEGLSIAAITYYFVGLIGYMAKSTKTFGLDISPELITGISVIPVGLLVWFGIRQVKNKIKNDNKS